MPVVSFVVPCYNLGHFLPQCIESIGAQTYRDFEILIMDNCSPDNTPEIAQSFNDPRVRHIRNDVNIGHLRNFNKGITMSRGKYVWLVSADDYLRSPDVLQRFVDVMEQNPGVGYVFCRAVEVRGSKEVGPAPWTECAIGDQIWNAPTFVKRLIESNCVVMSSAMVRRECYSKLALFPLDMPYAGDWYLWLVFALNYGVAYLSEPMVCCRIHEESLTTLFSQGNTPVCIVDELNVLWRVARQAEAANGRSFRGICNASIASRVARSLRAAPGGDTRPGLSEADFEKLLGSNARDRKDERDVRSRVYMILGDDQYWHGEYKEAMRSYWLGLKLRPLWAKVWTKYLLLRMGKLGIRARRLLSSIAAAAGIKKYRWLSFRTQKVQHPDEAKVRVGE